MALSSPRDLRIDLFRGLALWMIFSDHIYGNFVSKITYHALGYSDSKEIFLFLSGLSCSILLSKIIKNEGIKSAQYRALYRVSQIYLGYVIVALFTLTLMLSVPRDILSSLTLRNYDLLFSDPARAYVGAVILDFTPDLLNILPLYIILVAFAPLLIILLRQNALATLSASMALWMAAGAGVTGSPPSVTPEGAFNPLSWQFIFCIGLWAGLRYYVDAFKFSPTRLALASCWAVVAGNIIVHLSLTLTNHANFSFPAMAWFQEIWVETKGDFRAEHFLSLTHFLAVASLIAVLVPSGGLLVKSRSCKPLILCGQHSLSIFCLGAALSTMGNIFFVGSAGVVWQFFANALGWGLMAGFAFTLALAQRTGPKSKQPARRIDQLKEVQSWGDEPTPLQVS
jgi:hypothetical protein